MKTLITKSPRKAAGFLKRGGVVAFPTETVYGLGANAFDSKAVAGIFKAKGRPADNPLIVHISDRSQLGSVASQITPAAEILMDAFFPGPLTVIVPKSKKIPDIVSAGLSTVGVRQPRLKLAREFIRACGVPVAAPSANVSGRPSGTNHGDVLADFKGRIPCVLQGSASRFGVESTVVDCTTAKPRVLRLGAVSLAQIEEALGYKITRGRKTLRVKSPGMKYRHYAPKARVIPFEAGKGPKSVRAPAAYLGLSPSSKKGWTLSLTCRSVTAYARHLYGFLRLCDRKGLKYIYCELPPQAGLGATLRDRLLKAAEQT